LINITARFAHPSSDVASFPLFLFLLTTTIRIITKGKANIRQKKKRRKQTKELQKKKPQNIHIVYVQKKKHTYLTIFVIYI